MAMTSKAALASPDREFASDLTTRGVWKRKTVTSCFNGRKIILKTVESARCTCMCDLIRVGEEFFVAYAIGDHRRALRQYHEIWAAVAKRDEALSQTTA